MIITLSCPKGYFFVHYYFYLYYSYVIKMNIEHVVEYFAPGGSLDASSSVRYPDGDIIIPLEYLTG